MKAQRVIGYRRVSHQDQCEEGVSLDAQQARIEAYAKLHNLDLVGIETDEGISAGKLSTRPAAQRVLGAIRSKAVCGLVIVKLDRFARSTRDALKLADLCKAKNVVLHSIEESLDTSTAIGGFFFTLMAALAELESRQVGERSAAALAFKRSKGEKLGGKVPFGYIVDRRCSKEGVLRLLPQPNEQAAIRWMIDLRQQGLSLREIADELSAAGIRPKGGGEVWWPHVISRLLAREGRAM